MQTQYFIWWFHVKCTIYICQYALKIETLPRDIFCMAVYVANKFWYIAKSFLLILFISWIAFASYPTLLSYIKSFERLLLWSLVHWYAVTNHCTAITVTINCFNISRNKIKVTTSLIFIITFYYSARHKFALLRETNTIKIYIDWILIYIYKTVRRHEGESTNFLYNPIWFKATARSILIEKYTWGHL